MRRMAPGGMLLLAAFTGMIVLAPASSGQNKAGDKKGKVIETKSKSGTSAAAVPFAKELGVDLEALGSLGARVDQARSKSDPVILAGLANELAAVESAAGKQASLTSAALLKESVDLAKMRYLATELKVVGQLAGTQGQELLGLAKKAAADEMQAQKDREAGVKPRGITRFLIVDSRSSYDIAIYVNGVYKGTVPRGGDRVFLVGDSPWSTTYLRGQDAYGGSWTGSVSKDVADFTWKLTD